MVAWNSHACPVCRARRGKRDNARLRSPAHVQFAAPGAVKRTTFSWRQQPGPTAISRDGFFHR
jgi:hypothetical protein